MRPITVLGCRRHPSPTCSPGPLASRPGSSGYWRPPRQWAVSPPAPRWRRPMRPPANSSDARSALFRPSSTIARTCCVDTELAVAVTWDAARANGSEAELAATMAAGQVLPAYQRVALQNVQVHGGIGYTWEHDAHLYVRRATVLLAFAGGQDDAARERGRAAEAAANVAAIRSICHQRPSSIAGLPRNSVRSSMRTDVAGPTETLGAQRISAAALAEAVRQSRGLRRAADHRGSARRTREAQSRAGRMGACRRCCSTAATSRSSA